MTRQRILLTGLAALALIFTAAFVIARISGKRIMTPEKVMNVVQENQLTPTQSGEERLQKLRVVADAVNRLDYRQREDFNGDPKQDRALRRFMDDMTEPERKEFVTLTVERHFQKIMAMLNDMDPERRKALVNRSLERMQRDEEGRRDLEEMEKRDPGITKIVMEEGFSSYYKNASTDVKMDMAPLLEEIQRSAERRAF